MVATAPFESPTEGGMPAPTIFRHARWRVLILGTAGLLLGPLMIWESWDMLDPAWHTEASRGGWFNYLPPALRTLLMAGLGILLLVIAIANVWVVVRRKPALILDAAGLTSLRLLQWRLIVPWHEIVRVEEGKTNLLLHRADAKPLVIGYDWLDAGPQEIRSAVETYWRNRSQPAGRGI